MYLVVNLLIKLSMLQCA